MSTYAKKRFFVILNIVGFIGVLFVNGLANILPINGRTTGELSDLYPNLFVPAGITFSIWGVIYLALALLMVYQVYALIRREITSSLFLIRISWWFVVSCVLNMGWIIAWHYEVVWLSVVIMLLLLCVLIRIYQRLDIGSCCTRAGEKYFVFLPFSLYLGWISIAFIANMTAFLVDINWQGFGLSQVFWTVTVIIAGIVLAFLVLFRKKDIFYPLAVVWALTGIVIKRMDHAGEESWTVMVAALTGAILLVIGMIVQIFRKKIYG
jgi:hypothetical protein